MKKWMIIFMVTVIAACVGYGIYNKNDGKELVVADEDEYLIYYLSPEGNNLYPVAKKINKKDKPVIQAKKLLEEFRKNDEDFDYQSAMTKKTQILEISLNGTNLMVNVSISYKDSSVTRQVLCRAALAKTLTQIDGISTIELNVAGEPLMDGENVIGPFNGDSYIDYSNKVLTEQVQEVILYFPDSSGQKLKRYELPIRLDGSISVEQMVIENLMKGPDKDGYLPVVPKGTKLNSVSTKEGICYVDFNRKFLSSIGNVTDEVAIYAIVNSLSELPTVNKVQFTIEGEKVSSYHESIAFDQMFERKLDLIKGE